MTRIDPNVLIFILLVVVVAPFAGIVYAIYNGMFLTSGGGRLVAGLLGAVVIFVGGEILIKMKGLTGTGEKATRVAFILGALIVATVGIYQVLPTADPAGNNADPSFFTGVVDTFGWFGILAMAVTGLTLAFGAWRYSKTPGNASAYLFMGVVAFIVLFGAVYNLFNMVAPNETRYLLDGLQNSVEQGVGGMVQIESLPNGQTSTSLKWEAIFDGEFWKQVAIIAILTTSPIVIFHQYVTKNKLMVTAVSVVALTIGFGSIYYLLKSYEPAREVMQDLTSAAGEVNPFRGETHHVNANGPRQSHMVGPYDDIVVYWPASRTPNCNFVDASPRWRQQYGFVGEYIPFEAEGSLTRTVYRVGADFAETMQRLRLGQIEIITVSRPGNC